MDSKDTKMCRTCLINTGTIALFHKQEETASLYEKIKSYSNINIYPGDGFPDQICNTCESELAITHDYILKCIASDIKLRELTTTSVETDVHRPIKEEFLSDSVFDADYIETNIAEENEVILDKKTVKVVNSMKRKKIYRKKVPKNRYMCLKCGLKVNSPSTLKIHELVHSGEKPFKCDYCDRCFTREDNRTRHLLQHTRGRKKIVREPTLNKYQPEQCSLCGLIIRSHSAMLIHMRSHTGEKPFSCDNCDKCFRTKGSLRKHHETNHLNQELRPRKYICEACGKSFYRKRDIVIHMVIHTGERPHACPFCSQKFTQLSTLIIHKRRHTGDKPFHCKLCDRSFADSSALKKHQIVHSDKRNYQCHLCEKKFKAIGSLRAHLGRHKNPRDNICNQCGTSFSTKGNLTLHMSRKHSEKSGECEVCLKMVSNLQTHMRCHTGEKPEVCKICKKGFSSKISLNHHKRFKHETGKYKCTIGDCEKTFPKPSMLEFHLLKFHTNQTPHVCKHCSRGFYRHSDLSNHFRLYHPEMERPKAEPSKIKQPLEVERPPKVKSPID